MENLNLDIKTIHDEIIAPSYELKYIIRDGYAFTPLKKENVFDALIVGDYLEPNAFFKFDFQATRTLDECVSLINKFNLESAIFLTNDVTVLKRCPSIKCFTFYQNSITQNLPKFSSLYLLPGVRQFRIGDTNQIEELYVGGNSPLYFQKQMTLKYLNMCGIDEKSNDKKMHIKTIEDFNLPSLVKLTIIKCGITSLKGIEKCSKLQWLDLSYLRSLSDISFISTLAPTLRSLSFENCPQIADFSVISELKELEYLELKGKNELPNLDFIKELPKLKFLKLSMTVLDGDVSCLQSIQYVDAVCKKHYNLRSRDLPKDTTNLGFQFI